MTELVHSIFGYNRSFTNEVGHRIVMDVERNDTLDVVRIFVGGPESDGLWRITHKEAEELRDALTAVLGFPRRPAVT